MKVARVTPQYVYDRYGNIYTPSSITETFDDYPAARKHADLLNERKKRP